MVASKDRSSISLVGNFMALPNRRAIFFILFVCFSVLILFSNKVFSSDDIIELMILFVSISLFLYILSSAFFIIFVKSWLLLLFVATPREILKGILPPVTPALFSFILFTIFKATSSLVVGSNIENSSPPHL